MGLSEAAAAGRRLASLMAGQGACAPLAGTAAYARAAPHNRAGPGAIFDRAACEAHLAATYGGNPETLKNRRTKGGHPISALGNNPPPLGCH